MYTINCGGRLLDLTKPVIMGILNTTPDSFYDGGRYNDEKHAILQAERMIGEGASIIDVGGMSSKPGSAFMDEGIEIGRVLPAIKSIRKHFPDIFISVDTFRKSVAHKAYDFGADIINDISAGDLDKEMIPFVASAKIPYIMMHMKGIPENMQQSPGYEDVVHQVFQYLFNKVSSLKKRGHEDLIIDPGFGFGKSLSDNFELLKKLEVFKVLDKAVLVGLSRKSMLYNTIGGKAEDAIHASTAAHTFALQKGAAIIRTHDVKAANDTLKIYLALEGGREKTFS